MISAYLQHRRSLLAFFGIGFSLHLLWENLQMPLYAGFEYAPLRAHFWICFKAAWGDVLFMLAIYAALAVVHGNVWWLTDKAAYAQPATWVIAMLVGILLAVSFELWAVYVDHRWQYAAAMPMIPVLQVGLTPVLQMLFIPATTLLLISRFSRSL